MTSRPTLLAALLLAFIGMAVFAQMTPIPWHPKSSGNPKPQAKPAPGAKPPGEPRFHLTFDKVDTTEPGVYLAQGNVRFTYPGMVLTCDALTYDSNKETLWATGSVSVDFGDLTLSGTELNYDLKKGTGVMRDAYGSEKSGLYVVEGREIRKTGVDWYEVEDGTFTSCNAAEPPWSIRVSKSRFHVDHYAYLTNPRFKIRKAPIFYLPYIIWPIKPDRSTGLLFPQVGNSSTRGFTTSNALFLAPADWWDDTIYVDTFETEGTGVGEEFRYALTPQNYGWLHGYYIRQQSDDQKRWDFAWTHFGKMANGWQLMADVNLVSDANFWRDYQRDYSKGTLPGNDSRVYLTKQWGPYSLNLRGERLVQFYTLDQSLVQRRLPGIEWRSSLQPLGAGFYGGFETSADSFTKEWAQWAGSGLIKEDLRYQRADFHPFIEWPVRTVPWLDISPRLELRATGYSESLDQNNGQYDGGKLWRRYASFSLDVSGPRFYRRFKKSKHVVEPFATFLYVTSDDRAKNLLYFDSVDQVLLDQDILRYGIRNRLYAKGGRMLLDSELYQSRSARNPLSVQGDLSSQYSPWNLSVRAWPTKTFSVDLRLRYSILFHELDTESLSVNAATKDHRQFVNLSYLRTKVLGSDPTLAASVLPATKEVQLSGAFKLWGEKITANPYLARDIENKIWRDQRLIFWYHGSCYALGFEAGRRQIGDFKDTEVRFLVSLKNVGNVVDLSAGNAPVYH